MALFRPYLIALLALIALTMAGCATLPALTPLTQVRFQYDHISDARMQGIDLTAPNFRLGRMELAQLGMGMSSRQLPLAFTMHLRSENPAANRIAAHLSRLDWVLLIDGRETIRSSLATNIDLAAGQSQTLPVQVRLNLFDFFNDKNGRQLLDLAMAVAGAGGRMPQGVALKVTPTIDTPFGPIAYPEPITVGPPQGSAPTVGLSLPAAIACEPLHVASALRSRRLH